MGHFREFVKTTARTLFSSVVGWTLNLITFAALWISVTFQSFPVWVWIAIAVLNVFIAMFIAWRKEKLSAEALKIELEGIKSSIPEFSVHVGDIKKYSIEPIIESVKRNIGNLEQAIENSKKPKPLQPSASGLFGGAFMNIKIPSIGSFMPEHESNEDKLARLRRHMDTLLAYEKDLDETYQISLSIESTRHDKNIEVEISSTDTYKMTVQDNYEIGNIPSTTAPGSRYSHYAVGDITAGITHIAGKYYIQSSADGNVAISELAYLNASRSTGVFDSSFYIHTKETNPVLHIKIHSTQLSNAQVITEKVNLKDIPITHLHNQE